MAVASRAPSICPWSFPYNRLLLYLVQVHTLPPRIVDKYRVQSYSQIYLLADVFQFLYKKPVLLVCVVVMCCVLLLLLLLLLCVVVVVVVVVVLIMLTSCCCCCCCCFCCYYCCCYCCCFCCCFVVVLTLTRTIKSVVTGYLQPCFIHQHHTYHK